jgi:hypothetical protein
MTRAIRALSRSLPAGGADAAAGSPGDVIVRLPHRAAPPTQIPPAPGKSWGASAEVPDAVVSDTIGTGAEVFRGFSAGTMYDADTSAARGEPAAGRVMRITPLAVAMGFAVGLGLGLGLTLAVRLAPALMPDPALTVAAPAPVTTAVAPEATSSPPVAKVAEAGPAPLFLPLQVVASLGNPATDATGFATQTGAPEARPTAPSVAGALAVPAALSGDPVPLAPDPAPPVGGRGPVALSALRPLPTAPDLTAVTPADTTAAVDSAPLSSQPLPVTATRAVPAPMSVPGTETDPAAGRDAAARRPSIANAPTLPSPSGLSQGMDLPTLPGGAGRPVPRPPGRDTASLAPPAARPDEPDLGPARATPAARPAFASVHLRLMVPPGFAPGDERALSARLAAAGFAPPARREVDIAIKGDQVRFYAPADREAAVTAALALGAKVRDFSDSGAGMPPGVIEVWLRNADAKPATTASSKSASGKKPARAKPVKAARPAPAPDPLAQALRDQIIAKLRARQP